jgi:hypothetical protein
MMDLLIAEAKCRNQALGTRLNSTITITLDLVTRPKNLPANKLGSCILLEDDERKLLQVGVIDIRLCSWTTFIWQCLPKRALSTSNFFQSLFIRRGFDIINVHTVLRLPLFHPLTLERVFNAIIAVIAISTSLPVETIVQLSYHIAACRSGGNHRCQRSMR